MQAADGLVLRAAPDWAGAAQLLIDGCAHADGPAERIELLERLCDALGDALYPAFLKVLCVVSAHGSEAAQAAVAQALVDALASGRLPSGRRPAWGARQGAASAGGQVLGPIEYLCAWYAQADAGAGGGAAEGGQAARREAFDASLLKLLNLVARSPRAREAYRERLRMVAHDPIGGALARGTRQGLLALAEAWQQADADAARAATRAFLAAAGEGVAPPWLSTLASPLPRRPL